MSYLSKSEIDKLQSSDLCRKTPFAIRGVSMSQFSIARYSGGITFNGKYYAYLPASDELIREDVLKFLQLEPAKTTNKETQKQTWINQVNELKSNQ